MRCIDDLERNAVKFWPETVAALERDSSIIPRLIATQDKFISLLNVSDADPFVWKRTLSATRSLSGNLFLKHLMVLADVGGETLMRLKRELPVILGETLEFSWESQLYSYDFQTLSARKPWSNRNLRVDGESLGSNTALTPMMEDVCMLLLFGGAAVTERSLPSVVTERCVLGTMLGHAEELDAFVRQRYVWVSRITGGATANTLGQLAQSYVKSYLENSLPGWRINRDRLPGVSQNERTPLSVDIVVRSPRGNYCAVEVSFQVTTNSTIERKAGQAKDRQERLHAAGHRIAYVVDGAGNFARRSALETICRYSDCTVSFRDEELDELVEYLKSLDE